MSPLKIVGLVLIIAGLIALAYGGFSYTKSSHDVSLGPVQLQVNKKEQVDVPKWAGIAGVAVGVALLAFGGRRR
jgi:multidrug transporter EmrE-like cation transporter